MRWDNLFDDLESQLEQELTAEDIDLRAEEERLRLGRMSIRDRLASIHEAAGANSDYVVRMIVADGSTVALHPVALGKDWVSGDLHGASVRKRQCILPLAAIGGIILDQAQVGLSLSERGEAQPSRALSARLSLVFVLRDLCRRRAGIDIDLASGSIHGTIDRVGRDHIDLAVHESGVPRRESAVQQRRIIPLSHVTMVRL